jgi:hypothetical protein
LGNCRESGGTWSSWSGGVKWRGSIKTLFPNLMGEKED